MKATVIPQNRQQEPAPLVAATMIALYALLAEHPIAFYDLVMKCTNPSYQFFGNTAEKLQKRALLQPDGSVHGSIRNIVLAATTGEDADLHLHSPYQNAEQD